MSDPQCPSNSVKRRLEDMDETLEKLSRTVEDMRDFSLKAKLEHRITSIRLKREKTQALAAVARSQNLLAEMEILIAQNDVNHEIEQLKTFKRIKMHNIHNNLVKDTTQAHSDKASQTNKSRTKINTKKTNDNKKNTTNKNSLQSIKDSNKRPELVPTSSELNNKTFENRTPTNANSLNEVKNKPTGSEIKAKKKLSPKSNPKVTQINNTLNNLFKIPLKGQKTANRTEIQPVTVSRHSLPAVITQPSYEYSGSPFRLIYGDEAMTGEDFFRATPAVEANDNQHCEMVNNFFRELLLNKGAVTSSPIKMQRLNASMNSATTVKLEELLSS